LTQSLPHRQTRRLRVGVGVGVGVAIKDKPETLYLQGLALFNWWSWGASVSFVISPHILY